VTRISSLCGELDMERPELPRVYGSLDQVKLMFDIETTKAGVGRVHLFLFPP